MNNNNIPQEKLDIIDNLLKEHNKKRKDPRYLEQLIINQERHIHHLNNIIAQFLKHKYEIGEISYDVMDIIAFCIDYTWADICDRNKIPLPHNDSYDCKKLAMFTIENWYNNSEIDDEIHHIMKSAIDKIM